MLVSSTAGTHSQWFWNLIRWSDVEIVAYSLDPNPAHSWVIFTNSSGWTKKSHNFNGITSWLTPWPWINYSIHWPRLSLKITSMFLKSLFSSNSTSLADQTNCQIQHTEWQINGPCTCFVNEIRLIESHILTLINHVFFVSEFRRIKTRESLHLLLYRSIYCEESQCNCNGPNPWIAWTNDDRFFS